MKKHSSVIISIIGGLLLLGLSYATAQESMDHQHMAGMDHQQMQHKLMGQQIKVGKKGDITFSEPTQVGDVTLPPGHYVFQHRVSGDDHFVKFVGAKEMQHAGSSMTTPMQTGPTTTQEIKCTVEGLNQKVQQTAVTISTEGGARRITRIEVAGENVAHVF
jgi:hypothetical protein